MLLESIQIYLYAWFTTDDKHTKNFYVPNYSKIVATVLTEISGFPIFFFFFAYSDDAPCWTPGFSQVDTAPFFSNLFIYFIKRRFYIASTRSFRSFIYGFNLKESLQVLYRLNWNVSAFIAVPEWTAEASLLCRSSTGKAC